MSRKVMQPVTLPKGVEVKVENGHVVVKGPKGTLKQNLIPEVEIKINNDQLSVALTPKGVDQVNLQGLYRALISNMLLGVTQGFQSDLEMIGVGYRAAVQGKTIDLQIGFSHPTVLPIPEGVTVKIDKGTAINISGPDKQVVGQFAASIRAVRPPEPYQGKGIRKKGEYVRKKAGKAAAKK